MPTITELTPPATLPLTGTELVPLVQSGTTKHAPVSAFSGGGSSAVSVLDYGADPTGVTDSTTAIQAAINYAFPLGINVYIPHGIYKVTAHLTIGTTAVASPTNLVGGWKIYGDGAGILPSGIGGGTVILLYGTGVDAILKIGSSAWRFCDFSDFTLMTNSTAGATYGMLFNSTEFSQHTVKNVNISQYPGNSGGGPSIAFGVLQGTGVNGEFIRFEDCKINGVDKVLYSNAGQAFVHRFDHCTVQSLNAGGIYFDLDNYTVQGGGLVVIDFEATATQASGISNSTLLHVGVGVTNQQDNSPITFLGGRIENLTQIYSSPVGQTANLGVNLSFRGMEMGIDFDPTVVALTKSAVIDTSGNGDIIKIDACRIFANQLTCTFPLRGFQWNSLYVDTCRFESFARKPDIILTTPVIANTGFSRVRFKDCTWTPAGITYLRGVPLTMDMNWEQNVAFPGRRSIAPGDAWVQSGWPQQWISHPEIGTSYGAAVTPTSPWVLSSGTIGLWDYNNGSGGQVTAGGTVPRASTPFARVLKIPHGATLYQDLTSLDLSAGLYTTTFEGLTINTFVWELQVYNLLNAAGKLQIVDSVSGVVYADYEFPIQLLNPGPQLISLSANILQTGVISYPRIKIVNTDPSATLIIDLVQQSFYASLDACRSPAMVPGIYVDEASVVDYLIAISRLALPVIADGYGSSGSPPNLASDIYRSSTDNKLTYYTGSRWNKALESPNAGYAGAAYSPTIAINATTSGAWGIYVSDNVDFAVSSPTGPLFGGQVLTIRVLNQTGGAIGVLTFGAKYKIGAAWVQPASGKNRSIQFQYDQFADLWYEISRSAADVNN